MRIKKDIIEKIKNDYILAKDNKLSCSMFNVIINQQLGIDKFKVIESIGTISINDEAVYFKVIVAGNIFTALLLAGYNNVPLEIQTPDIKQYNHNSFLTVDGIEVYVSGMLVYENEMYKVYYIKSIEGFIAHKIC